MIFRRHIISLGPNFVAKLRDPLGIRGLDSASGKYYRIIQYGKLCGFVINFPHDVHKKPHMVRDPRRISRTFCRGINAQ